MQRALITGGAGFIGSHLADTLLESGYEVRALDNLSAQVHPGSRRPAYLSADVELQLGDVRDPQAVRRALDGADVVVHLAAAVGVGQSMYEVERYTDVNVRGTAVLLEELAREPKARLVVASSMSTYGEGLYRTPSGALVGDVSRSPSRLRHGDWEPRGQSGERLVPVPTPESKAPSLASIYALSKHDQERMCLMMGEAYGIPTVALRFFNVYGPRQALSNPYTGVLAIFAARLLNDRSPLVFEDGRQQRDFVSVHDVATACRLALEREEAVAAAVNVGSGAPRTVLDVAATLASVLGRDIGAQVTGQYRVGDIRHCFADIGEARRVLGYEPRVAFDDGLRELASWLDGQLADDNAEQARAELASRGLTL
jgi:dTDP-L-rhamnose 4-epimerase